MRAALLGVSSSLSGRAWRARLEDDSAALALAQRTGLPELLARILAGRGVGEEDAAAYLAPTLKSQLPDPSVFADMDKAAERLAAAVMTGEPIAIFGDYDVDGATSSALLHRFLSAAGAPPLIYIPDRIAEGYGPNAPALLKLAQSGVKVVVTVDCGTMAHAPLAAAKAAGLDVIVADHHQQGAALPEAFAIVNPNRTDDLSGQGALAAVGVSFLLAVATNRALRAAGHYGRRGTPAPDLMSLLDLVALGTVCDVVSLRGLNRILVMQGLKVMGQRRNTGLAALAAVAGVKEGASAYSLGFQLGPRVNAGGRVGRADLGARLLTTSDADEAAALAAELDVLNRERQAIEAAVLDDAVGRAVGQTRPLTLVAAEGWHPGVIGIVAGRLKERFGRPAFVIALDDAGLGKGSGRSMAGVDLGAGVAAAVEAGLLINGGGHAMAAGLTVRAEAIPALHDFLDARLGSAIAAAPDGRQLAVDGMLAASGVTVASADEAARAGPYGPGNPEPVFAVPHVRIVHADVVGAKHIRVVAADASGARVRGIAWRALEGPLASALLQSKGRPLHLAGKLKADAWNGERRPDLTLEDAAWAA